MTKRFLMVVVSLVVSMSVSGQCKIVSLRDTKDERYSLCMPQQGIEDVLKNCTVDWCKFVKDEQNMYTKVCILQAKNDRNISRIMLISGTMEDSIQAVKCQYVEFSYDDKVLYIEKADEKLWWKATNVLNNIEVKSPE